MNDTHAKLDTDRWALQDRKLQSIDREVLGSLVKYLFEATAWLLLGLGIVAACL